MALGKPQVQTVCIIYNGNAGIKEEDRIYFPEQ